ncbi:hypothetical protein EV426DRAFT_641129 [Tirmania nivea]|nr:hypothetical protein EV426DRAFT_641129 [Tirmania nivea]
MTKWVATAWKSVSANRDMITRSFRKCGITVPIDGTADSEIHIEGISNYTVPDWQLPPESEDQPDLLTDTEDESSDLEIVDDEEEADGSDMSMEITLLKKRLRNMLQLRLERRSCEKISIMLLPYERYY